MSRSNTVTNPLSKTIIIEFTLNSHRDNENTMYQVYADNTYRTNRFSSTHYSYFKITNDAMYFKHHEDDRWAKDVDMNFFDAYIKIMEEIEHVLLGEPE